MSINVYEEILSKVSAMLKNGIVPWRQPYSKNGCCARSHQSKEPYSFLNQMLLDQPGEYWTFNQVQKEGKRLKKGCKAKQIYFWKLFKYDDGEQEVAVESDGDLFSNSLTRSVPFLKRYNVFHESDIECFEEKKEQVSKEKQMNKIDAAETIINNYFGRDGAPKIEVRGCIPSYSPSKDRIQVPDHVRFDSMDDYYDTLFHEMVHSTGIKNRLDRGLELSTSFRGDEYSKEELVAEMGGAMLSQKCGLSDSLLDNNAAYCAGWLKHLAKNPKWIVWAASRSEAAVKFILTGEKRKVGDK